MRGSTSPLPRNIYINTQVSNTYQLVDCVAINSYNYSNLFLINTCWRFYSVVIQNGMYIL